MTTSVPWWEGLGFRLTSFQLSQVVASLKSKRTQTQGNGKSFFALLAIPKSANIERSLFMSISIVLRIHVSKPRVYLSLNEFTNDYHFEPLWLNYLLDWRGRGAGNGTRNAPSLLFRCNSWDSELCICNESGFGVYDWEMRRNEFWLLVDLVKRAVHSVSCA